MSQDIVNEITFFMHSFLLGIAITFAYDGFLILRKLIKHSLFMISLEDLIFWIACAIGVFYMLYEENNGTLRWFAVFGATIGMLLYKKSVSPLLINVVTTIIKRIFGELFHVLRFLLKPFRFLGRKMSGVFKASSRKGKKVKRAIKNKLTDRLKLLKITMCKH